MSSRECGAKARTNSVHQCRQPAMANGRCRLHGGKSTGPKTQEGLLRLKQARTIHGFYTKESIAERRELRAIFGQSRAILDEVVLK